MNQTDQTIDMLDETLDDLADLPQTAPFPAGAYLTSMVVRKNSKKQGSYIAEFTHKETIELADPHAIEPAVGDKSVLFVTTIKKDGTKNEFGQGTLKLLLKPLAALYDTNSVSEILEQSKTGVDVVMVCSIRKDKTGQYDDQQDVKKIELV